MAKHRETYLELVHILKDLLSVLGHHSRVHRVKLIVEHLPDVVDLFPIPLCALGIAFWPHAMGARCQLGGVLDLQTILLVVAVHADHCLDFLLAHEHVFVDLDFHLVGDDFLLHGGDLLGNDDARCTLVGYVNGDLWALCATNGSACVDRCGSGRRNRGSARAERDALGTRGSCERRRATAFEASLGGLLLLAIRLDDGLLFGCQSGASKSSTMWRTLRLTAVVVTSPSAGRWTPALVVMTGRPAPAIVMPEFWRTCLIAFSSPLPLGR